MKKKSILQKVSEEGSIVPRPSAEADDAVGALKAERSRIAAGLTVSGPERLDILPDTCPRCGRKNSLKTASASGTGLGWHHYRFVPSAPAAGCGACGYIIYVTEQVFGQIRNQAHADYPKAAAGKITKRLR